MMIKIENQKKNKESQVDNNVKGSDPRPEILFSHKISTSTFARFDSWTSIQIG